MVQMLSPFANGTLSYKQRGNRAGEAFAVQQSPVKLITGRGAIIN